MLLLLKNNNKISSTIVYLVTSYRDTRNITYCILEIESLITIPLSRCSSNNEIPLSCSTLKAAQLIFVAGPLPLTKGEGTSRKYV